ncbi:MAG TPA: heavy metal-binding domain-containing protein [Bryobacteraceae bacterium]|nr:heavy metal-binding domain-containing protein [Bryobacteraceae bacterium]
MRTVLCVLLLAGMALFLGAQDKVFICPMDPDVRSNQPGTCRRCGMKLREGLPEPEEYHLDLALTPRAVKPGQTEQLKFSVHDPWKDRAVKDFQIVHEKLFHMFVVSQDLKFFVHDHPVLQPDGDFLFSLAFPKPGMYRVLGDFYPDGATPQLIAKTVIVPGAPPPTAVPPRDYSTKQAENLQVEMTTDPPQPIAAQRTLIYFKLSPADGIEKYIGAWAHMLAASDDLIDLIHTHPFIADGGPQLEFNMEFPRARTYRVWVQFQRKGVVNTAHFDIPVKELE